MQARFHAFWKSLRRGRRLPRWSKRGAPAGARSPPSVRGGYRLLIPAASADPAPSGRPRLPPLPLAGALVFDGRLAETALRAHVFPRIKCPEKIVDSRARGGVLALTS